MLSFLRATAPPRTNNATNNPIIYEGGLSSMKFHAPGSQFIMTHQLPPVSPKNGTTIIQPPFHFHIYQTEYFNLRSGTGHLYLGIDPKPFITLSDKPDAPRTASIPAGRYHRFENASKTEDLVVDVHLTPEDYENEQRFFRNFFGYLDDCKKAKTEPSLFQLLVFLHSADTPLALPLPNEWLGIIVSRVFLVVVAFWGKFILGYQDSYAEYYEEGKSK
ncbi:hypothetical protein BKA61DRAFT_309669 [Leptodontidium sp. MPI-SDFR-AT-0119]|nr:hypothetical protein BKA61DRAFT_309669 [Leptodontidium sp. MPI-SDFR-AT-0119]